MTYLAFSVISGETTVYFRGKIVLLKHLQPDLAFVGNYGAALQIRDVHHPYLVRFLCLRWLDKEAFLGWFRKIMSGTILAALIIVRRAFSSALVTWARGRRPG